MLCASLAACATGPRPEPGAAEREARYDERAGRIGGWTAWTLTGRLGVDLGEDGGSGRLDWRVADERQSLQFRGALGQGAWRLESGPGGARLERANGEVREAASVGHLVYVETGWTVPVEALAWWVRGLASPADAPSRLELNADGTPQLLEQRGWRVRFKRYGDGAGGEALPTRLEAIRGDVTIKLAVSRWGGRRDDRQRRPGSTEGGGG